MSTKNIIKVDESLIHKSIGEMRKELLEVPHRSLYNHLIKHDLPNATTLSDLGKQVESSMGLFFGTYKALRTTFDRNEIFQDRFKIKETFKEVYSYYISATNAHELLEDIIVREVSFQKKNHIDFSKGSKSVQVELMEIYLNAIKKIDGSPENLVGITRDYYNEIVDDARSFATEELFESLVHQAENLDIEVNGKIFSGFNSPLCTEELTDIPHITYDEIVGNEKALEFCKIMATHVVSYDPKDQTNYSLENTNKTGALILVGPPGTGKSMIISAMRNHMFYLASKKKIPFNYIEVNNNQIKSKYVGEGVKALNGMFKKVKDSKGIGLLVLDDADQILESRDEEHSTPYGRELLHEVQRHMDGVNKDYKGNYLVVFSSNRPDLLDDAIKSRLGGELHTIKTMGPQSISDYAKIFELKMGSNLEYINLHEHSIQDISQLLYEKKLNGRDIETLANDLSFDIGPGIIPEDIVIMYGYKQRDAINKMKKQIDFEMIANKIGEYNSK